MTEKFIKSLLDKVNTIYLCYYEEADNEASFPYCVIPSISFTPLNDGYLSMFDIEIYNNELSNISVEQMIDQLRVGLDGYSENSNGIAYHIGFENQLLIKQNEQDLIVRRVSFSARIFN